MPLDLQDGLPTAATPVVQSPAHGVQQEVMPTAVTPVVQSPAHGVPAGGDQWAAEDDELQMLEQTKCDTTAMESMCDHDIRIRPRTLKP